MYIYLCILGVCGICALALCFRWCDSISLIEALVMAPSMISVSATWYLLFNTLMYILRLAFEYHHQRLALVQSKDRATLRRGEGASKSHIVSGGLLLWLILLLPNHYPHPVCVY